MLIFKHFVQQVNQIMYPGKELLLHQLGPMGHDTYIGPAQRGSGSVSLGKLQDFIIIRKK